MLLVLFSLTCLFSITRTKQSPLDDYMQMIYHQPAVYQHLLATSYPVTQAHHFAAAHIPRHHANSFNHNRYLMQPVATALDYNYSPQQVFKQSSAAAVVTPQSTASTLARLHRSAQLQTTLPTTTVTRHGNGISDHHDSKLLNLKLEGAKSVIPLQSIMRNHNHINQRQAILLQSEPSANNYNSHPSAPFVDVGPDSPSSAATSVAAGLNGAIAMAAEATDDPALVAANLIDSLDADEHNGGHFDYNYQGRDQPQFTTVSAINNNSLALFRLLNFIDQSPSAMPFQGNSKTSLARPILSSANMSKSQAAAGGAGAANANINLNLNRHQAKQYTSTNYPNNWSRKRDNQMHWRHQNSPQQQQSYQQFDGNGVSNQSKQDYNSQLVDGISNSIEVQPAALKLMKTSSHLNTPSRSTSSSSSSQTASSSRKHNNNNNGNGITDNNNNGVHQYSNGHANGGAGGGHANGSSLNNNNDDTGFGNKQSSISEKLNGPLTSSTLLNSKVPHDADSEMIAANNAPRCDKFTPDICVDDFEYPEQAIIEEIQKKRDVFELMYSEVKDNEPLVDGIPRDVEESYNYDYYYYGGKANLSQAASQISPQTASSIAAGLRLAPPHSLHPLPMLEGNLMHSISSASRSPPSSSSATPQLMAGNEMTNGGSGGGISADQDIVSPSSSHNMAGLTSRSRLIGSIQDAISSGDKAGNLSMMNGNQPLASSIDGMDALIGAITSHASSSSVSAQSPPTTGFICPSEVMYGKPKLAKNKKGLWKVIVNAGEFTQTVRLEKCLLPNKKCNYVSAPYESRCAQVHSYHRLLVFEKGRGFYIDTFRLPTGCNCHVTKKAPISRAVSASGSGAGRISQLAENNNAVGDQQFNSSPILPGSRLSSLNVNSNTGRGKASSESMLSQTLWSILSGGAGGGAGAGGGSSGGGGGGIGANGNQFNQYASNGIQAGGAGSGNSEDSSNNHVRNAYQSSNNLNLNLNNNMLNDDMSPAQREAYQSQSAILDHLSQNPSLAANISDSVLRQLIDVGQISAATSGSAHAPQLPSPNPPPIHHSTGPSCHICETS